MSRLKKKSDYLVELRENHENVDTHKDIKDQRFMDKNLKIKYPSTSEEKDKSLYSFNRLKNKGGN